MKANELMVGDWVKVTDDDTDDSFIGQVKAIDELGNVNVPEGEDVAYPYSIDCLEPIPLTPEILEKNGFEKIINAYSIPEYRIKWFANQEYYFTVLTGVDGYWNPVGFIVTIGGVQGSVDYVHQLQHALRLCEIEKEIEL